jgi:hypothetical protein
MPFDPDSTAALVAQLAATADDGKFNLEAVETTIRSMPSIYTVANGILPAPGERPYIVAYTFLYRRVTFSGGLICGQANIPIAQGTLAQDALFQQQLYDLRNPVTAYTAGGSGVVSGP